MANRPCPRVLGIDEHFFTRKKGYATTFVDLSVECRPKLTHPRG